MEKFGAPVSGNVFLPGSKSISNRVLILAALSGQTVLLKNFLHSEDTAVCRAALEKFGAKIRETPAGIEVSGGENIFKNQKNLQIDAAASGTTMRFCAAVAALRTGETILRGTKRMHERPIGDLVDALRSLGARVEFLEKENCPPIKIFGQKLTGNKVQISGKISSQFLTAILQIAPFFEEKVEIKIIGNLVSRPYVEMTIKILEQFGAKISVDSDFKKITVFSGKLNPPREFQIESDATAASYFWGVAAATGGEISVEKIPENSTQGDIEFLQVLEKFGCKISRKNDAVFCRGPRKLKNLGRINLEKIPDAAMTAVVLSALAPGENEICGLQTLRDKECDRIFALETNLKKLGVKVESTENSIKIFGRPEKFLPAEIKTFLDHRVAMSFAVISAAIAGITILNPDCVGKTFPDFWEFFEKCRP